MPCIGLNACFFYQHPTQVWLSLSDEIREERPKEKEISQISQLKASDYYH